MLLATDQETNPKLLLLYRLLLSADTPQTQCLGGFDVSKAKKNWMENFVLGLGGFRANLKYGWLLVKEINKLEIHVLL